jgi:hypothetical protein
MAMGETIFVSKKMLHTPAATRIPNVWFDTSGTVDDTWTVVHEFAHAWDQAHGRDLSKGLMNYTGGYTLSLFENNKKIYWVANCGATINSDGSINFNGNDWKPGCNKALYVYAPTPPKGANKSFTPGEDWAESVAAYVYPTIATAIVQAYKSELRPKSWTQESA